MKASKKKQRALKHEHLLSVLKYDKKTGIFKWKKSGKGRSTDLIAGNKNKLGYIMIKVNYRLYASHRLAYFYVKGVWPDNQIDHINHITNDNRWCNLRNATDSENLHNSKFYANNTSGHKGVYIRKCGKWVSEIKINGERTYLGIFDHKKDAANAYRLASIKHFGKYHNEMGLTA